ncbi:unnamed protein product [Caenorhabditis auriculariae]|uniref:Methylthioribose-1-phosphate isomerase n=1 Tax=Caenorhabditis auriculariae TaxID=2777116 RepID=A0A8S1GTX8_9PELO|nr:unnamed protein product [Caenorhabditis auriculariae]
MSCSTEIVNGPIPKNFLSDTSKRLDSLLFKDGCLQVLDQLLLPHSFEYIDIRGVEDAFKVIKSMQVRGAPLIATVGCLGLFVELESGKDIEKDGQDFRKQVLKKIEYLISSRPTAVDLRNALNSVIPLLEKEEDLKTLAEKIKKRLLEVYEKETVENRQLVWNAYQEVVSAHPGKEKLKVMTICNTGSLATCSWGTALGAIRALHAEGRLELVYALETRPYNQGIRLTASELLHGGVPFKVITDSMAAWVMKNERIDAVLTGADNVALNGDSANKIGTYMLAVLCKHHGVPFYPVVPRTSINRSRETGDGIIIEERPSNELLQINGQFIGPEKTPVWNPAFDVTPADLITKVLTDFGNFEPKSLKAAVETLDSY